jgi:tRNA (guanine9-N1)-methyltransferase
MSESSTNTITAQDATTPLSKNAIKKAAKAARLATLKLDRRAREKEAKKEKKRIRAEKRAAGELNDEEEEEIKRRMKRPKLQFGGTVVVDLGFDSMMNDKVGSITSSSSLGATFFLNRKLCPCAPSWHTHIVLTVRPRSRFR